MGAAALAAQDLDPAADLLADAAGQGLDALLDGLLVGVELPGGVGDEQATLGQELHHPSGAGAWPVGLQRPDVGLGDGGVGAEEGQQDPQAPDGQLANLLVPVLVAGVLPERFQEGLGGRGEGRQLLKGTDGEEPPVPPRLEQRALRRVDQVRRDRWRWWAPGGGLRSAPHAAVPVQRAGEGAAQPELDP